MNAQNNMNQNDYLKKYLSLKKSGSLRRKHKRANVKVIDDDIVSSSSVIDDNDILMSTAEELPQVAAFIDEGSNDLRQNCNIPKKSSVNKKENVDINVVTKVDHYELLKHAKFITDDNIEKSFKKKWKAISNVENKYSYSKQSQPCDDHPKSGENGRKSSIYDEGNLNFDQYHSSLSYSSDEVAKSHETHIRDCLVSHGSLHERDGYNMSYSGCLQNRHSNPSPPCSSRTYSSGQLLSGSSRQRQNSDQSPPRRTRQNHCANHSFLHSSQKRHSSDQSPPCNSRQRHSSDQSPPRNSRQRHNSDQSPPRNSRQRHNSDQSPLHNSRQRHSSDQSPRTSKQKSSFHYIPYKCFYEKKQTNRFCDSVDETHSNNKPSYCDSRKRPDNPTSSNLHKRHYIDDSFCHDHEKHKLAKSSAYRRMSPHKITSPCKKADQNNCSILKNSDVPNSTQILEKRDVQLGKIDIESFKNEKNDSKLKKQMQFKNIDDEFLGKYAKTIVRDRKTGKIKGSEDKSSVKQKEYIEMYKMWNKGLKQIEEQKVELEEHMNEMKKPLARYANDEDLERELKSREREGDPMLMYMRRKQDKLTSSNTGKQYYKGHNLPLNRFGILPGYRWDGVDRSNGFEARLYEKMSSKEAMREEAYKWSVEDM